MATNKRKTTTAIVAGVTAVALLLGGTFAWTSISQTARNEAIVDINPGGRLHDDFNGTNKDVYVENFSSGATGVDIFARIRLDQYFEVGQDAGTNKDGTARKVNKIFGDETDINSVETWVTYTPGDTLAAPVQANDNWQWTLGNGEDNKPYYMPTFNMNKDSLAADINGTYEGTTEGDIVHYDDYVVYVDAEGNPKTVTGTEVYDWDDEDNDEEETPVITTVETTPRDDADVYHKENQTHTAEQISTTATVITMAEWIALGSPIGPYWVYDTDGWAYWAQPIAPGETTGLLLDKINMSRVPDDNWYYGINVVGQFATKGDIYMFEDMSPEAEDLFATVSGSEEIIISGADTIAIGETATYTATRMTLGNTATNQPDFVWTATATDADGQAIEGISITDGVLITESTVPHGTKITVTAAAGDGTATAAEGDETTTEALSASKTVTALGNIKITAANNTTKYTPGTETTETFTATLNGENAADGTLTWTMTDGEGNELTETTFTDGTLTIGADETVSEIILTATYKATDGELEFTDTYTIGIGAFQSTDDMAAPAYWLVTEVPLASGNTTLKCYFVRSFTGAGSTYRDEKIVKIAEFNEAEIDYGPWEEYRSYITEVVVDNPIVPTDSEMDSGLFANMRDLKTVDVAKLDVSKLNSLSSMFNSCVSLRTIKGLDKWDVSSVTDFSWMFYLCDALETIEGISAWDVGNAQNFEGMFRMSRNLLTVGDLSEWNVSNATNMSNMFSSCTMLTVDCSSWDVSNVTNYADFSTYASRVTPPNWVN